MWFYFFDFPKNFAHKGLKSLQRKVLQHAYFISQLKIKFKQKLIKDPFDFFSRRI